MADLTSKTVSKPVGKGILSLPQIIALYIGAVLGSGILLIPGLSAEIAGPASVIAWAGMSLLVLPMGVTMGLLAARYPHAGGVSHFVRLAYGDWLANLVGWFFLLSVPLGAPIVAVTGTTYLAGLLGIGNMHAYALAALLLLAVLMMNLYGLRVAGRVQTLVVSMILVIILLAVAAAMPNVSSDHFTPFLPHGWLGVVKAAGLLFWCFIGWEAVTHLSAEFVNPERNAIRGVLWSAGIIALLYFAVAFMTVATGSYGSGMSEASLSIMIQLSFGPVGGWSAAGAALFICIASTNSYVSAAARTAYALAQAGFAPTWFGRLHRKYGTPVGGLAFLAACFALVIGVLMTDTITLAQLIQLPNATFFATYIGGCFAGIRLLSDHKAGRWAAWISLVVTLSIYPFLGWAALYPLVIVILLAFFRQRVSRARCRVS
ncbi:MAG: amino acid permease [Brevibacillus sp.]|nr:amino acid permease [Brevibacillus sp.]